MPCKIERVSPDFWRISRFGRVVKTFATEDEAETYVREEEEARRQADEDELHASAKFHF